MSPMFIPSLIHLVHGSYSSHGSMDEQMGVRSIEWGILREDKNKTWWTDYAVCMPYKSNKGIRAHEMKEERHPCA